AAGAAGFVAVFGAGAAAEGAAPLAPGVAGLGAEGVAAVRARHSLRKSAYFLSPTVLFAFMAFHSSLHVFKRLCAPAGPAESPTAAQTAAAQRAASPDFMMTSPV